ncbi:MAG: hypothetical protein AABW52_03590, partial [Nanoarchaeota archaeon]
SYNTFVNTQLSNVLNRNFYIIIREKDNIEMQTTIVDDKLKSIGLKTKRLETEQLIKHLHNYLAQGKEKTLNVEETKNVAHYLYSPEKIKFYHNHYEINEHFYKTIAVIGYPNIVETNFLDNIINSRDNYDISLHIEPFPIDMTMINLNRELQKQQSDLYTDNKKGIINPSLEIKFKSTRKVLEDLQKGKQKLYNVSLYITCKGKNKEEVILLSKKVKSELDSIMIQNKNPQFQMIDSYASSIPLIQNKLNIKSNIHTEGLSTFYPFSSPYLDIENDGILLGLNKNNIPYIKNIFHLANANGIILATSGAGKSYFTKLLLSRQYMN